MPVFRYPRLTLLAAGRKIGETINSETEGFAGGLMRFDLLSPLAREGLFFASISSLLVLAVIIALLIRTLNLPKCMKCGFDSVRRAKTHTIPDNLAWFFLVRPYRCGKCLRRFYCFRSHRTADAAAHRAGAST